MTPLPGLNLKVVTASYIAFQHKAAHLSPHGLTPLFLVPVRPTLSCRVCCRISWLRLVSRWGALLQKMRLAGWRTRNCAALGMSHYADLRTEDRTFSL